MTIEHAPSTNGRAAQAQQRYDEQSPQARKSAELATTATRHRPRLIRLVVPALLALAVVATFRVLEQRAGKS